MPCLRMPVRRSPLLTLAALGLALGAGGVQAQTVTSRPVAQALPSKDVQRLNNALVELARRPKDMAALLEAGDAALAVDDLNAALGFYQRARDVEPGNWRVPLGLAKVYLRSGRPALSLPLFEEAEKAGADPLGTRSDKALALDMVGDQSGAQGIYPRVIESIPNDDDARRRLAVSYAITGNSTAFEATLRPLIERRDFAAFRARAFGLAIMGEQERAAAITDAVMPRRLAVKITPYLAFMPRLTPAQQAAAANLGVFPKAADIGRDSAEVVAYRQAAGLPVEPTARAASASADERLEPAGERLEPAGEPLGGGAPVRVSASDAAARVAAVSEERKRVADAFGDMAVPSENNATAPASGAVDIASIEAPREAPPQPAKPKHPSRIWVQLATGRDLKALGFDWRRLSRKAPDLLKSYEPHTVRWGQANRLLAGPLDSRAEARDLINALKKKGIDTFRYTSPEGSEIQRLRAR